MVIKATLGSNWPIDDGLVFIAMQVIGALLAYVVYRYLFSNTEAKSEKDSN